MGRGLEEDLVRGPSDDLHKPGLSNALNSVKAKQPELRERSDVTDTKDVPTSAVRWKSTSTSSWVCVRVHSDPARRPARLFLADG
jgi:hypothetical protein